MPKPEDQIQTLSSNLRTLGESAGVPPLPEHELQTPKVYTGNPNQRIVCQVADLLATGSYGLYRRGLQYGTITEAGEWVPMDAERMATWLPIECGFLAYRSRTEEKPLESEFAVALCRAMLASDQFRKKIPVIRSIHPARLPVFRAEIDERGKANRSGFRKIELLPTGYDKESQTYTLRAAGFDEAMDPDEAATWVRSLLHAFPWGDERSQAVQVAAMLSAFCRLLYAPGRAPMFVYNANLPGSGKTNLAKLALVATFRDMVAESGYSHRDHKAVRQELDSAAQEFAPCVFFDDVPHGKVQNADLNKFVSGGVWQCRVLGENRIFRGRVEAMVVLTGNRLGLTPDLMRRALYVDLFANLPSNRRTLPGNAIPMTPEFFADEQMMNRTLAALWALVRMWDDLDRPRFERSYIGGFENWAMVVPNIVEMSGWGSPCLPFESEEAGDTAAVQVERLMRLVVAEHVREHGSESGEVTLPQIVGTARRNGLFVDELGTVEDVLETEGRNGGFRAKGDVFDSPAARRRQAEEWMDGATRSKWGKSFRKNIANGRFWMMEDGSLYQLGDRTGNKTATKFRLSRVRPATA